MAMKLDDGALKSCEDLINDAAPNMDDILRSYILSYFKDDMNLKTFEPIYDFLEPLLKAGSNLSDEKAIDVCSRLTQVFGQNTLSDTLIMPEGQPVLLKSRVLQDTSDDVFKLKVGDVRLGQHAHNTRTSVVDRRKLLAAEKKLAQKRALRKSHTMYAPEIPWDLRQKAQMMVSQSSKAATNSTDKNIKICNFEIKYSTITIVENGSLSLSYGRKYGLVGRNGIGKSTLLSAISSGELKIPSGIRVQHIEQNLNFGPESVLEVVMSSDRRLLELSREEKLILSQSMDSPGRQDHGVLASRLEDIYTQLDEIDSNTATQRAVSILKGIGFSPERQNVAANTLSGGWKMRLSIARALFTKHDLLLADEITNFLDFPAIAWLETFLKEQKSTLLIVSHDVSFLDAVTTDIIHMHDGKLDAYKGNYSAFLSTVCERQKLYAQQYHSQLHYKQHLQSFVDRWRYNAKRASQAQSRLKMLAKLPDLESPEVQMRNMVGISDSQTQHFSFECPSNSFEPLVQLESVYFGYDHTNILENVDLGVHKGSKIAIVGPNGCGKSTLLSLIIGRLRPNDGMVKTPSGLKIGFLTQHHMDQLPMSVSPTSFLMQELPDSTPEVHRSALAKFGICGTTALQPIATLSGGQKSRVAFTYLSLMKPHLLMLDEPTNHLDIETINALSRALKMYSGAFIIVSHDEAFLDQICEDVYVLMDTKLTKFIPEEGNQKGVVKQYKESLKL